MQPAADHWHAYHYTNHERPADNERKTPENRTPPMEIAHWLLKPARFVEATYTREETDTAEKWILAGYEEHPPTDAEAFPVETRMGYVREDLARGADVIATYYSGRRYISRALIACPRGGRPCPY